MINDCVIGIISNCLVEFVVLFRFNVKDCFFGEIICVMVGNIMLNLVVVIFMFINSFVLVLRFNIEFVVVVI